MARRLTTEEWIEKAKLVHGKTYNYSKVEYVNNSTPVEIICKTHGVFTQRPNDHTSGSNCPECAIDNRAKLRTANKEQFIIKANKSHNDFYNYNKVVYVKGNKLVTITCPIHGDFEQRPNDHVGGQGCPACSGNRKWTVDEFVSKAKEIHGDKYNYSLVKNPIKSNTKVKVICPEHGIFTPQVGNHINSKTICPQCAGCGFDTSKPAYLYYLKVTTDDGQELYKIGITNRTVNERFSLSDLAKIEIVKQKLYENGQDALDWETKLKQKYKEYQYKGPAVLKDGNTELFTEDIISMWYDVN